MLWKVSSPEPALSKHPSIWSLIPDPDKTRGQAAAWRLSSRGAALSYAAPDPTSALTIDYNPNDSSHRGLSSSQLTDGDK